MSLMREKNQADQRNDQRAVSYTHLDVYKRQELRTIGATTLDEYRKYSEKDAALERRFQPVMVSEPSVEDTIAIQMCIRDRSLPEAFTLWSLRWSA